MSGAACLIMFAFPPPASSREMSRVESTSAAPTTRSRPIPRRAQGRSSRPLISRSRGWRIAAGSCRRSIAYIQNAVVVGTGPVGRLAAQKLLAHPEYGVNLVGFIDSSPMPYGGSLEGLPVLGSTDDLEKTVEQLNIERVIIAFTPDSHEDTLDAGPGGQPRLVGRVEHDRSAGGRRLPEEVGVLVVPVDDQLVADQARGPREGELARGRDVGANPLVSEKPQQRDVREGLRAEEQATVTDRLAEPARTCADRLLAEDDERRPVLARQGLGRDAAEAQGARFEARRVGEELWHRPIVPVTVETVKQLLT